MVVVDEGDVRETFNEHFEYPASEEIIRECVQLCNSYAKTPEDIAFKWQSMCLSQTSGLLGGGIRPLDSTGVTMLRKELQKDIKPLQGKRIGGASTRRQQARPPLRQPVPKVAKQPPKTVKLEQIGFFLHDKVEDRSYRYMHERLTERSTVLDDRIDEFAELVREHYKLDDIGDPASSSDEDQVVVGRICWDEESKFSETTIMLETSRLMGAGARIPLKFNENVSINRIASTYPLFPGAIVALKGRNDTGNWFQVSGILTLPSLPPNMASSFQERPISMIVAAGPFTPDTDLEYKPFSSLLLQLRSIRPSWLLLLGPFIDANNSLIKTGDVDISPADIMREKILLPLGGFLKESPETTVLIVSSVRDLLSHHAVYPQPALSLSIQSERIIFLPNPCTFTIDHVKFCATSVDVLHHLGKQVMRKRVEPSEPAPPSDNILTLSTCILEQRCFYPIFPAEESASGDVNLDVSHSEHTRISETAPDVLIVPSVLKQFNRLIDSTCVVNPSSTSKGVFAELQIADGRSAAEANPGRVSVAGERVSVRLHASKP